MPKIKKQTGSIEAHIWELANKTDSDELLDFRMLMVETLKQMDTLENENTGEAKKTYAELANTLSTAAQETAKKLISGEPTADKLEAARSLSMLTDALDAASSNSPEKSDEQIIAETAFYDAALTLSRGEAKDKMLATLMYADKSFRDQQLATLTQAAADGRNVEGYPLDQARIKRELTSLKPVFDSVGIKANTDIIPSKEQLDLQQRCASIFNNYSTASAINSRLINELNIKIADRVVDRISYMFLDISGTPKAEEKNRAFMQSLGTAEGCGALLNRYVKELLSADPNVFILPDRVEDLPEFFIKNHELITKGIISSDIESSLEKYMSPEIAEAFTVRRELFQAGFGASDYAKLLADPYFPYLGVLPKQQYKAIERITTDDDEILDAYDEKLVDKLDAYGSKCYFTDTTTIVKEKEQIKESIKNGELDVTRVPVDKNGNKITYGQMYRLRSNGEATGFVSVGAEAAKELYDLAGVPEASRRIEAVTRENNASHAMINSFGKDRLAAQGKQFAEDCRRLYKVIDDTDYAFSGSSDEFKEIRKELKHIGFSDKYLNSTESKKSIDKILKLCDTYMNNKLDPNTHQLKTLKPREQRRYDAVSEIRDHMNRLARADRAEKFNAKNDGPGSIKLRHNLFNQNDGGGQTYHANPTEHAAIKHIEALKQEMRKDNALTKDLAYNSIEAIELLRDAELNKDNPDRHRDIVIINQPTFRSGLASLALLSAINHERANMGKNENGEPIKGALETKLENLFADEKKRKATISEIVKSEPLKTFASQLENDPLKAMDFLNNSSMTEFSNKILQNFVHQKAANEDAKPNQPAAEKQAENVANKQL